MTTQNHTPLDKNKHNVDALSKPKESEPVAKTEAVVIQETVEHEKIEEEVKPHIQIRPETIKLPPDLRKIGLRAAKESKFNDYKNIVIPISDDKVIKGLHEPITSSLRWLATFALYLLKKAHLTLKIIHGRVVRVVSR